MKIVLLPVAGFSMMLIEFCGQMSIVKSLPIPYKTKKHLKLLSKSGIYM